MRHAGSRRFGRLLRVDGIVEGNINSPNGNLIVGIDGIVVAKAPSSDAAGQSGGVHRISGDADGLCAPIAVQERW